MNEFHFRFQTGEFWSQTGEYLGSCELQHDELFCWIYQSISLISLNVFTVMSFLAEFSFTFNLISRQQNFETDGFGFSSCELLRNRGPVPFWQRFRMFSANVTSNYWAFWHFSSPLFNLNFDFRLDLNQFPSLWKMVANLRVHNSSFLEVQLFKPVEKLESRGLDIQLRMDINIK